MGERQRLATNFPGKRIQFNQSQPLLQRSSALMLDFVLPRLFRGRKLQTGHGKGASFRTRRHHCFGLTSHKIKPRNRCQRSSHSRDRLNHTDPINLLRQGQSSWHHRRRLGMSLPAMLNMHEKAAMRRHFSTRHIQRSLCAAPDHQTSLSGTRPFVLSEGRGPARPPIHNLKPKFVEHTSSAITGSTN